MDFLEELPTLQRTFFRESDEDSPFVWLHEEPLRQLDWMAWRLAEEIGRIRPSPAELLLSFVMGQAADGDTLMERCWIFVAGPVGAMLHGRVVRVPSLQVFSAVRQQTPKTIHRPELRQLLVDAVNS